MKPDKRKMQIMGRERGARNSGRGSNDQDESEISGRGEGSGSARRLRTREETDREKVGGEKERAEKCSGV